MAQPTLTSAQAADDTPALSRREWRRRWNLRWAQLRRVLGQLAAVSWGVAAALVAAHLSLWLWAGLSLTGTVIFLALDAAMLIWTLRLRRWLIRHTVRSLLSAPAHVHRNFEELDVGSVPGRTGLLLTLGPIAVALMLPAILLAAGREVITVPTGIALMTLGGMWAWTASQIKIFHREASGLGMIRIRWATEHH